MQDRKRKRLWTLSSLRCSFGLFSEWSFSGVSDGQGEGEGKGWGGEQKGAFHTNSPIENVSSGWHQGVECLN